MIVQTHKEQIVPFRVIVDHSIGIQRILEIAVERSPRRAVTFWNNIEKRVVLVYV